MSEFGLAHDEFATADVYDGVVADFAADGGVAAHAGMAEGDSGGDVEVAAKGVDVEQESGVVTVELEVAGVRIPGVVVIVAEGGTAQAESHVGVRAVSDAHAKSQGAPAGGDAEVRVPAIGNRICRGNDFRGASHERGRDQEKRKKKRAAHRKQGDGSDKKHGLPI